LFAPQIHVGGFYFTPELALVIGNLFSYMVSPKRKMLLTLKEKVHIGKDLYNFVFTPDKKLAFQAGQYLEWTLGQKKSDSRGNRRYFTVASSPMEPDVIMGVKFYKPASSFKQTLFNLPLGGKILAGQLAGDFTLPTDLRQKFVFIAGGIGITPFRSIIQSLIDANQKRDIVLFYSNKTADEIVYDDVFDKAAAQLGIRTIYTLTDPGVPTSWKGKTGFVNEQMIKDEVPDYQERSFYISGPHGMVTAFEDALSKMKVSRSQIKIDFFPGYV
jgi:ferredoxin-NADP reductase